MTEAPSSLVIRHFLGPFPAGGGEAVRGSEQARVEFSHLSPPPAGAGSSVVTAARRGHRKKKSPSPRRGRGQDEGESLNPSPKPFLRGKVSLARCAGASVIARQRQVGKRVLEE